MEGAEPMPLIEIQNSKKNRRTALEAFLEGFRIPFIHNKPNILF